MTGMSKPSTRQTKSSTTPPQRIIVGISGASGVIYGVRLLQALKALPIETHLVMTRTAEVTLAYETDLKVKAVQALADRVHAIGDMAAPLSSGSFRTLGMVIAPCSMRSLGELASGVTSSLLTRAADVVLKERRKLVLLVRETPLHNVHLRNMLTLSEMGAIIAPAMPAFYSRPKTLDEVIDHSVARTLDLFGLSGGSIKRWAED